MIQTFNHKYLMSWLVGSVVLAFAIVFSDNSAFCQQIKPDNTLGQESSVVNSNIPVNNSPSTLITGGAVRGENLFHSFKELNVDNGQSVYFNNPNGIERIITRVTGNSRSEILGKLGISSGNADLFLLNPNGIIFGPNASLDLNGSFLATTASSFIFPDAQYSALDSSPSPLLSVNFPSGLQFRNMPGAIINQSQTVDPNSQIPFGLQVKQGKSLALVGGNITMAGGLLSAPEGRVELASISDVGQVNIVGKDLTFGYEGIPNQNFGDIKLFQGSSIFSVGEGNGNIYLQGKSVTISDSSSLIIFVQTGKNPGGKIKIVASDSIALTGASFLLNSSFSEGNAGDVEINAQKVFLRDRSYIQTAASFQEDNPGSFVISNGQSGNVSITTTQMEISNGSYINASTIGAGEGGNILINSSDYINIFGVSLDDGSSSGLFASSESSSGALAGNITLKTRFLRVADGATVNVSSIGQGTAGNIDIFAHSVLLENRGSINAETKGGEGNIIFHEANDIILRHNSSITTNATGSANGGNITINTGVLLALSPTGSDGSDIVAKADKGRGGNIVINAKGIFGIEKRIAIPGNQTNDIDASSQFGRSGQVDINTAIDPNNGLTELPETVVDPDTQVAQNPCNRGWGNELTVSGRGGLPPSPSQDLSSEATQVKLVEPVQTSNGTQNNPGTQEKTSSLNSVPEAIVASAQGWVYNKKGQVVLVAYDPTITGAQRLKVSPAGCPVP
jgi:filamentous hemagglutinin family protein